MQKKKARTGCYCIKCNEKHFKDNKIIITKLKECFKSVFDELVFRTLASEAVVKAVTDYGKVTEISVAQQDRRGLTDIQSVILLFNQRSRTNM